MEAPTTRDAHTAGAAADDVNDPAPNLEIIYQAFGEHSDLYKDVLQVKPSATAEQIQMAYFDRRSELFALLASIDSEEEQDDITASHRFHAERKMDAVVMAVRILGDPQLREEYDNVMVLKESKKHNNSSSSRKHHPKEPPSSSGASRSSSTREPDGVYAGMGNGPLQQKLSPKQRRSSKKRSSRHNDSFNTSSSMEHPQQHFDDDNNTMRSTSMDDPIVLYTDIPTRHDNIGDPVYDFVAPSHSRGSMGSSKGKHHNHNTSMTSNNSHDQYHQQQGGLGSSFDRVARDDEDAMPPFLEHSYGNSHHHNTTANEDSLVDPGDDTTLDDTKLTWDDGATLQSEYDDDDTWTKDSVSNRRSLARRHSSALSAVTNNGIISRIQEEVAGTVEDTLVSFEQVLNVFTLQERDIQAVMGRIDKAKRQLRKRT